MGVENQQKDPEQEAGRPTRRSASDATSTLNNRSCCAYQRKAGASDSTTTTRQQKNCITQTHNKRTVDQNNPKAQRPEAKQCRRVGELISLGDRPFPTTPTDRTPSVTQPGSSPGKRGSLGNPTRELPEVAVTRMQTHPGQCYLVGTRPAIRKWATALCPDARLTKQPLGDFSENITEVG